MSLLVHGHSAQYASDEKQIDRVQPGFAHWKSNHVKMKPFILTQKADATILKIIMKHSICLANDFVVMMMMMTIPRMMVTMMMETR